MARRSILSQLFRQSAGYVFLPHFSNVLIVSACSSGVDSAFLSRSFFYFIQGSYMILWIYFVPPGVFCEINKYVTNYMLLYSTLLCKKVACAAGGDKRFMLSSWEGGGEQNRFDFMDHKDLQWSNISFMPPPPPPPPQYYFCYLSILDTRFPNGEMSASKVNWRDFSSRLLKN